MNFGGVGWRHCSTQYRPRPFPTCHYLSPSWCIQSRVTSLVPGEERGGWSGERWVGDMGEGKGLGEGLPTKGCGGGTEDSEYAPGGGQDLESWKRDAYRPLTACLQPGPSPEPHSRISNCRWPSSPPRACLASGLLLFLPG